MYIFGYNIFSQTKHETIPTVKMFTIIISRCQSSANFDNSAIARASPAAEKVPNPLLNPLLRVAPALMHHLL